MGHIFPENFIKIPQEIMNIFRVNINYFYQFFGFLKGNY